jgi:hypothetical protein
MLASSSLADHGAVKCRLLAIPQKATRLELEPSPHLDDNGPSSDTVEKLLKFPSDQVVPQSCICSLLPSTVSLLLTAHRRRWLRWRWWWPWWPWRWWPRLLRLGLRRLSSLGSRLVHGDLQDVVRRSMVWGLIRIVVRRFSSLEAISR